MERRLHSRSYIPAALATVGVLGLLVAARLSNYLLFHILAELFAIVVASCIFMVMWNSRRLVDNQYLLFLGVASLGVATVDVFHLLTYKGMGVLPAITTDVPTQLWVAGRMMQATALVLAPSMFDRKLRAPRALLLWLGIATFFVSIILFTNVFPSCFGSAGLTPFKIGAEYAIIAVLLLALVRLRRHDNRFRPSVLRALAWSITVTAVSELAFTLYSDPYGALNFIGHFLRILAFYLLYKAIIETALTEPHTVLFRELDESNQALRISEAAVRKTMALGEAMNGIDAAINSTLDLDEILKRALVGAADALGADSGAISFKDGDGWLIHHVYDLPQDLADTRLTEPEAHHLNVAAQVRMPILVEDALNDARTNADFMTRYGIRSLLTIPLVTANEVIGILTFHMRSPEKRFDADGQGFAARLAVALGLAIDNSRLYGAQREIAETLQNAMLAFPDSLPGVLLGHAYRSADKIALIGGDFYDAFDLVDGRIGLVLGDVSGKGVAAATASSIARTTLRAYSLQGRRPADVMSETNKALFRLLPEGVFATATYAAIDLASGIATLCSAGHPDPFVCTPDGCQRRDALRNRPLGLWEDTAFDEFTIDLRTGDCLVLFSDGLPDTRRNKEFFGEERIEAILDTMRDADPQVIVDMLMAEVIAFAGGQHTDDIAIVAATLSQIGPRR